MFCKWSKEQLASKKHPRPSLSYKLGRNTSLFRCSLPSLWQCVVVCSMGSHVFPKKKKVDENFSLLMWWSVVAGLWVLPKFSSKRSTSTDCFAACLDSMDAGPKSKKRLSQHGGGHLTRC